MSDEENVKENTPESEEFYQTRSGRKIRHPLILIQCTTIRL
jgi:hypothetical protein